MILTGENRSAVLGEKPVPLLFVDHQSHRLVADEVESTSSMLVCGNNDCSENHTNHMNALCGQSAKFLCVRPDGA
jgi:hypothetical protein